ncbi:unnamed protein product (macronuclear) [Paramecium tetraurelia]|uniref:COMM domain-containing protein n=1 Tax=Paramecium tetraurelia TaxID=5888 RepID=A0BTQ3_PARTE|nr:uncharacterized protein GSPATT00032152001 [Paramecium tetraurelia]CAK61920.1 unnamed protein product [Paramecium tetraurelia]|eukprot:XP_001429318.1 hypothetical protein (macronuclear) [Paramecium tetraurelia strain d4-2]
MIENNNNPSQINLRSESIRNILNKTDFNIQYFLSIKLLSNLSRNYKELENGIYIIRMIFFQVNPRHCPSPQQFSIAFLRWNGNLILVNMKRKFIDQLKEAYEIELDSQLVNQVNWRVTLDKVFSEIMNKGVKLEILLRTYQQIK